LGQAVKIGNLLRWATCTRLWLPHLEMILNNGVGTVVIALPDFPDI